MSAAAGWPRDRLGRLVLVTALFAALAPAGLVALPVAALGLGRGTSGGWRTVCTGAFTGLAAAWLVWPGDLPDQAIRAGALIATAAFVVLSDRTRWSVTHRALVATLGAVASVALLCTVLGVSWERLHWWVEHRTGFAFSLFGSMFWDFGSGAAREEFVRNMYRMVRWASDGFPAISATQLLIGFGLATALHGRLALRPRGRAPGALRDFRFSEHWGWLLVLGLTGTLMAPFDSVIRLAAFNLLALGGVLFLARGAAVTTFFWARGGASRWVAAAGVISLVFLMPVVLGVLLALGVLDAGLDLRRRVTASPPPNE